MAESITYRLASDSDTDRINAFYNRIYGSNRDRARFDWEYNSAPAGRAIYVVAEADGQIVGTQCAIPYYLVSDEGDRLLTGKSEDTLVSPEHRGRQIFENMYQLLIEECRKQHIQLIWGFTYAVKPFKKLGFDIPFASRMGLLSLKPFSAARYFGSISREKGFVGRSKITGLMLYSWANACLLRLRGGKLKGSFAEEMVPLNSDTLNYIQRPGDYGLLLDAAFIRYRITTNPYSPNYFCHTYSEEGALKACAYYNITTAGIGYIIHLHFAPGFPETARRMFLRQLILHTRMRSCIAIRFWGFDHNTQNCAEISALKQAGFTFLKRGISFVALKPGPTDFDYNPGGFVLSRMASQGTD